MAVDREQLARLSADVAQLELTIAQATSAIAGLQAEEHAQEKAIVAHEAQRERADEETHAPGAQGRSHRRRAAHRRGRARRARREARGSRRLRSFVSRASSGPRRSDSATRSGRSLDARDTAGALGAQAAEARATHAALRRARGRTGAEVLRLEESARELELRIGAHHAELQQTHTRRESLLQAIVDGQRALDEDIQTLVVKRDELRAADESAAALRASVDAQDVVIRAARGQPSKAIRGEATDLEVQRATAQSDLTHLAQTCMDAVQVLAGRGPDGSRADGAGRPGHAGCRGDRRRGTGSRGGR